MPKLRKHNYLDILQVYRGLAALMVIFHHAIGSLRYYHHVENPILTFLGDVGKFGVDFFFVLSGFIIAYSASFSYHKPNAFKKYITGRILRIYIPYLPIGIAMLFLYSLFPDFSNADREISWFSSLTLIPNGGPALSVAWTLIFEMMFYFLFSITFVSRKAWHYFIVFWVFSIAAFNYTSLQHLLNDGNPVLKVFLSVYNIEFILGYILAQLYIRKINLGFSGPLLFTMMSLGFYLYLMVVKADMVFFAENLIFGVFVFFMLYLSVNKFTFRIKKTELFMILGNATYSIYLIHNPIQMIIIRMFPKITTEISLTFAIVLAVVICCIAGYLYSLVFERKAIKAAKALIVYSRKRERIWT